MRRFVFGVSPVHCIPYKMEKKVGRNGQSGKANMKNGESGKLLHRSKQEEVMPYPAPWRKREIGNAWDNTPVYEVVDANGDTVLASVFGDKADRIIEAINSQSPTAK